MQSRRLDLALPAVALVGLVLGLDFLWSLLGGSTGNLAYGLADEPAHLATCAVCLLAVAAVATRRLPPSFAVAALAASMLIDLDHVPGYLGWNLLSDGTPRPYTHSLAAVALLVAIGWALKGRRRSVALGAAFGCAAHLFRDLATGPGIAAAPPPWSSPLTMRYGTYAVVLGLLAGVAAFEWRRAGGAGRLRRLRPAASRGGWTLVLLAAVLLVGGAAASQRASASNTAVGVYLPGADWHPELLDDYASSVGRRPAIVPLYRDWSSQPFERPVLEPIAAREAVPMVTWEPWRDWSEPVPLSGIVSGAQDAYIADAARHAADWGGPLFVRFAHEMNGSWYPWGRAVGENTPRLYRWAWRHVVRIFREHGADNVRWVWTPYVDNGGRPFEPYYPGDEWVDWAGFDGFNWGVRFMSFAKLFERSYRTMVRMTDKPLIVAEFGSIEAGGNKAIWIRRAMSRTLPRYRHVRALIWWSDVHQRGMDVRLDTSPGAMEAWSAALQAPRFAYGSELLLATPDWLRRP